MFFLVGASPATAQTTDDRTVRPFLSNVTRVEVWSFFDPPVVESDPDYTLVSNRARLGVAVDSRRVSFEGSFQYAQLLGLPRDAFGPGPLGPGALYYAAARTPEAYQLYFRSMSLGWKDIVPRLSLQLGRMKYESGEGTPFAGRLIGGAEWTPFERGFDGVRVDYRHPSWRGHASFVMPTQGAFEESANPTIGHVQLATASFHTDSLQVFAHNYRDTRAVSARPDNTGIAAGAVDVNVQTLGASAVVKDVRVWAAFQSGDWYGDAHRAFSISTDAGHAWSQTAWRPSLRGGVLYASGDDDPNDDAHGTFFPMVPTTRPDLLRGTYAQMNLRDIYAIVTLHPRERVQIGGELHHLSLAQRLDRWYSGTGATAFDGEYFGYSSRRSTLQRGLGTFIQLSASAILDPHWTMTASAGVVRGGDVVRRQFAGSTLFVFAVENVLVFR